jgi:hypothetical protein
MTNKKLSATNAQRAFSGKKVMAGRYSVGDKNSRDVAIEEQERQNLRELLLTGGASRTTITADEAYFSAIRRRTAKQSKP